MWKNHTQPDSLSSSVTLIRHKSASGHKVALQQKNNLPNTIFLQIESKVDLTENLMGKLQVHWSAELVASEILSWSELTFENLGFRRSSGSGLFSKLSCSSPQTEEKHCLACLSQRSFKNKIKIVEKVPFRSSGGFCRARPALDVQIRSEQVWSAQSTCVFRRFWCCSDLSLLLTCEEKRISHDRFTTKNRFLIEI